MVTHILQILQQILQDFHSVPDPFWALGIEG